MNHSDGFLCIRKEKGMTSHDVVFKIRRILGIKKTGHAGTLDPNAEGVLIVGVGKATRFIQYLEILDKAYTAELIFGVSTDTDDFTGTILKDAPSFVTAEQLKLVLPHFTGNLFQTPPVYSAIKINGKKCYDYARKGKMVDIPAREVRIISLKCKDGSRLPEKAIIDVECSKGTYIRSLCRDIGEALNTPACMGNLLRTRCGCFHLGNALTLSELEILADQKEVPFIDIDTALAHYKSVNLTSRGEKMVTNGCLCYPWSSETDFDALTPGELLRFHGKAGMIGIGRFEISENNNFIRPLKIIANEGSVE